MYAPPNRLYLVVPARHLVRNVTVRYAHRVVWGGWSYTHCLLCIRLNKKKKRGTARGLEQPEDPPLFGEPPSSRVGRRRRGVEHVRAKKGTKTPFAECVAVEDYFAEIGLDEREPIIEGPPPRRKEGRA